MNYQAYKISDGAPVGDVFEAGDDDSALREARDTHAKVKGGVYVKRYKQSAPAAKGKRAS